MMNNYSKDNNNNDWDKNSINSDVSANTDLKVFHGAINGNNYLNDLNQNDNNLYKKIIYKQQKDKNENLNNKINDKFNLDNYNLKEQKNDKTISNKNLKKEKIIQYEKLLEEAEKLNKEYGKKTDETSLYVENMKDEILSEIRQNYKSYNEIFIKMKEENNKK